MRLKVAAQDDAEAAPLRELALLSKLTTSQLAAIWRAGEVRRFSRREVLIEEGRPGIALYILQRGTARVVAGAAERFIARLGPGAPAGELALSGNTLTTARVVAETEVEAFCLRRELFFALAADAPDAALALQQALMEAVAERLRHANERLARVPFPPAPVAKLSVLEVARMTGDQRLERLRALGERWPLVQLKVGPVSGIHVVSHPELARQVLQEHQHRYRKSDAYALMRALLLGNGLITSDGEDWLRQRRLTQPAFHRERVAKMGAAIASTTAGALDRWEERARGGRAVDLAPELVRLTLDAICLVLLSDPKAGDGEMGRRAAALVEHGSAEVGKVLRLPLAVPTPRHVWFRRERAALDRSLFALIAERRRSGPGDDLLGSFLSARDADTGESMTDQEVRDQVVTMLLAGHETTASALAWTMAIAARSPDLQERLRAESTAALGERAPSVEDLPKLPLAMRVVQEAMRLRPPVWIVEREAEEDDILGEHFVPAGSRVAVCIYSIHRDPEHWLHPDRFDPDRFLPERSLSRHRFSYLPFGGGPRQCIGAQLALFEEVLILSMALRRFRLELADGYVEDCIPGVAMRPKNGVPCRLTPLRR